MPVTITATVPADIPRWATSGSAVVTAPVEAKKDSGFIHEKASFATFNWLHYWTYQYIQYLKDATDQIDAGKLAKDGGQDITGILKPDADNTRDLGTSARRFKDAYLAAIHASTVATTGNVTVGGSLNTGTVLSSGAVSGVNVNVLGGALNLTSGATVGTDLVPTATGQDLGSAGARWDVFANDLDIATLKNSGAAFITAATHLYPDADGTRLLGRAIARWQNVYAQNIVFDSTNPLAKQTINNLVLASGYVSSAGVPQPGFNNVAGHSHSAGTGVYVITFASPVKSGSLMPAVGVTPAVVGILVGAALTADNVLTVTMTQIDGTTPFDAAFNFTVIGQAAF